MLDNISLYDVADVAVMLLVMHSETSPSHDQNPQMKTMKRNSNPLKRLVNGLEYS